jgi:hypothetical protein
MAEMKWLSAGVALLVLATLSGCNGKPEEGSGPGSDAELLKTPAPPYPAFAAGMVGKPLSMVSKGSTTCKGKVDMVTAKHSGARKGSEVQGWAWDEAGAKPFDRVVFTDPSGTVIGAATVSVVRKDVPGAMKEITNPNVGWTGVIGRLDGTFRAVGLSANSAACTFDTSSL